MNMREWLSERYCRGKGLDIGAFHNPFPISPFAGKMTYLDKRTTEECRKMADEDKMLGPGKFIVNVDIVDCGERLTTVKEATFDFIVSSHQLEHCFSPFHAVHNHLRVTKPKGYLLYMLPDMRETFDKDRQLTTIDHLLEHWRRSYEETDEDYIINHHMEYLLTVDKIDSVTQRWETAMERTKKGYDVHFHTWTSSSMLEMFKVMEDYFVPFTIEYFFHDKYENYIVLRKS